MNLTKTPETMKTYCITFGSNHTHRISGVTLDCDCWVEITAENYITARSLIFDLIDAKWAFCYNKEKFDSSFYHRGCVLQLNA